MPHPDGELLSQTDAAAYLGVDRATLCRLRGRSPLYEPAVRPETAGVGIVRYHREQLQLIIGAWTGNLTEREAEREWESIRRQIGRRTARPERRTDNESI